MVLAQKEAILKNIGYHFSRDKTIINTGKIGIMVNKTQP